MKNKISCFLALIILAFPCLDASSDENIQLVKNGASEYRIMVGSGASPTEVFAAQELQGYVVQASGAFLPMANPNEPLTGKLIFVGINAIARLGLDVDEKYLGEDGFVIKTIDRRIIIAGKSSRGTLYGVYTFLESIGCRWLAPGINGEVIPMIRNIAIPPTTRTEKPSFDYRGFTCLFPNTYKNSEWLDWMTKNKLNCVMINSEAYDEFDRALGEEAIVRGIYVGVRFDVTESAENGTQNTKKTSKEIINFLSSHPNVIQIEIYHKDNIQIPIEIAGTIKIPEKRISVMADSKSALDSVNIAKHDFAFEPYMRCYRHSLGDEKCEINKKAKNALKLLGESSRHIRLYEHYMASYEQNSLPFPILQTIAGDMRYINTLENIDGVMSQCELDNWGTYGLNYYAFAKFSWNPRYDLGVVVDDYCEKYYGKAAEPMKRFFGLLEDSMANMEHVNYIVPPETILKLIGRDTLEGINSQINRAKEIAHDVVVFERIRKSSLSLEYTSRLWYMLYHYIIGNEYQKKGEKDKAKENLQKALENGEELIKFLFQNVDEGVFIITENLIFDYIDPIINDIRNRLDPL